MSRGRLVPVLCRITVVDYLLAAGLLSMSLWFAWDAAGSGLAPASALLYQDGELVRVIDLSRPAQVTHSITDGELVLNVEAGRIRVARTSCPRKVCQRQGSIGSPRASIVCAPQRVLIVVAGADGEPPWDALAY